MASDFRALIKSDPSIGAGNFLFRYIDAADDRSRPLLEMDRPYRIGRQEFGPRVTIGEFADCATALAAWYQSRGVGIKDPVAVYLENAAGYYLHYVALTRIGAIPALINGGMDAATTADYLTRVRAVALMTDSRSAGIMDDLAGAKGITVFDDSSVHYEGLDVRQVRIHRHHDDDPVLIGHTSGTTGAPKAVQFNHAGFFHGVRRQLDHNFGAKIFSAVPHSHAAAFTFFMSCVARNTPLFIQTSFAPQDVLASVERQRPSLVFAFPKIFVDMCRHELGDYDLSSVDIWMATGDSSHEPHIRKILAQASRGRDGNTPDYRAPVFIDNLGSSEMAFGILRNIHTLGSDKYDRCIGKPFQWVDLEIFDHDGEPAAVGTVGRLGVRAPSVTVGYWNDSVATEKSRWNGYWLTGDLVYRDAAGFYYHVDRTADKILTHDRTLYSVQVEELVMKRFSEVFDCTAVGDYSSDGGISIALAIEPVHADIELAPLADAIARFFTAAGLPSLGRIMMMEQDWNVGVTGKKLKRVIREHINSPEPSMQLT